MAWYEDPDPYTYEKIGTRWDDKPVYVVWLGDRELGVIESTRRSTDRHYRGSRIRHPGKGAPAFQIADSHRIKYDRRRDAGRSLEKRPWTKKAIREQRNIVARAVKRREQMDRELADAMAEEITDGA